MAEKKYPLSLIVKAVDRATAPLKRITDRLNAMGAPARRLGKQLGKFGEAAGIPALMKGFTGVGGALRNVGSEAFNLGAKLIGMAGVATFALFHIVKGAVDAGDKLGEMATRVGLGVNAYASLQHAAAQADVEQEAFNGAMDQFNKRLGEAKANGGPLLGFLQKVSPKLAMQVKGAKSTEAALSLMTDAFSKIEDPGKRAALAAATFGKSGLQMGEFLHQGSAAIQRQQIEYLRLAGSQEEFAKGAGELDNAMRDTETAFLGLRSAAFGALFPAFTVLAKAVTEFVAKNRDGLAKWASGASAAITQWVNSGGIERVIAGMSELAAGVRKVWDFIGGLKGAIITASAVMAGPLLAAIATAIPAIVSLGIALFTTPVGWFVGAIALIAGAAFLIVKNWEPVSKFFKTLWPEQVKWISQVADGLALLVSLYQKYKDLTSQSTAPTQAPGTASTSQFGVVRRFENWVNGAGDFGAEAARPGAAAAQSTQAAVSVTFDNLPPGARVTQDRSNTQPLDLAVGYAGVTF